MKSISPHTTVEVAKPKKLAAGGTSGLVQSSRVNAPPSVVSHGKALSYSNVLLYYIGMCYRYSWVYKY